MGSTVVPAPSSASLKPTVLTLTSGTSWTVPTGVTKVIATLVGGGGGGGGSGNFNAGVKGGYGQGGAIVTSTVTTTPGASITYAIGAGGSGGAANVDVGGNGGTTSFTGATSASGGIGGSTASASPPAGTAGLVSPNGGCGSPVGTSIAGAAGGAGCIVLEYWT